MKILYTILFFLSTFLLIFFMFDLLRLTDKGIHVLALVLLISGIIASIALLIFFLFRFLKLPHSDKHR